MSDSIRIAGGINNSGTSDHAVGSPLNPTAYTQATPPLSSYTDLHGRRQSALRPNGTNDTLGPIASSAIISPLPSQASQTSSPNSTGTYLQTSCFGDVGYMTLFSHDNVVAGDTAPPGQLPDHLVSAYTIPVTLREAFLETFFEHCFVWCPVLDRDFLQHHYHQQQQGILDESLLLQQALALTGNRINPPLIEYKDPAVHYNHLKHIFYNSIEKNALVRLVSIMLLFWWSTGAPNLPNMDNAYWWTGIAIRMAQEMGLHREPQSNEIDSVKEILGLRRRIWWTLFVSSPRDTLYFSAIRVHTDGEPKARDRILSISQGRPPIIDLDYCNVKMITPEDFPDSSSPKVQIFIAWVNLQDISGRIIKQSIKSTQGRTETAKLSQDLISWVQSLPSPISLSLHTDRTTFFDRDVHRLYVSYLTIIILLHLNKSSAVLPRASKAAVVAASCIARLFGDFLARGSVRAMTGDVGWEIAVAILALMHAYRVDNLRPHVEADLHILRSALREMAVFWPSSRMFKSAFDKLMASDHFSTNRIHILVNGAEGSNSIATAQGAPAAASDEALDPIVEADEWISYFPFVSKETSPLINEIMAQDLGVSLPNLQWPMDIDATLQQILSWPDDADLFDSFTF